MPRSYLSFASGRKLFEKVLLAAYTELAPASERAMAYAMIIFLIMLSGDDGQYALLALLQLGRGVDGAEEGDRGRRI